MKTPINDLYWTEDDVDGVKFGLTSTLLEKVGCVWNFAPRELTELKEGAIFANLETSRTLFPLRSPVSGKLLGWNQMLLRYPDKIDEDTFLFRISK